MAENFYRSNTATEVAQVDTFTITGASTLTTAVWTFTLTLEDGSTYTGITYTEDGSPTTTEIATGLFDAWVADTNPFAQQITATNPSAGVVTLTGTAGVPFSVTLADSSDGTHTKGSTTAVVSNTNYGGAANWSLDAVPVATNDVRIVRGTGTAKAILYGLDQSGVAIDEFRVVEDFNADIGKFQFGQPFYLQIDPDSFEYYGRSSLAMIDIGSANISPYIEVNGSPASGQKALYLKGSNIATLEVVKGTVGVAVLPGETATVATLLCSYVSTQASDVNLEVGSGVTLTTLTQSGGTCVMHCAATTVTNAAGTTFTSEGSGTIGTLNAYGTCNLNSTGTITTLNAYGTVDFTGERSAKTVSTLNRFPGSTIIRHSNITITTDNVITSTGSSTDTLVG